MKAAIIGAGAIGGFYDAGVVTTFSALIMEAVPLNLKGVPVGDVTVVVNLCDGYHRRLTESWLH